MVRAAGIVIALTVAGVIGLVGVASMQPDTTRVERVVTVDATPADVFPLTNDLRRTLEWSPWADRDPNQETAFADHTAGVGAWYTWDGNDDVGSGKQEIIESVENERVVTKLSFIEPFESEAQSTVTLTANGDQTQVSWAFESENDLMGKAVGLFMDMDAMIGGDFETGLARLKPLAEAAAVARAEAEAAAAAEVQAAAEGDAIEVVD